MRIATGKAGTICIELSIDRNGPNLLEHAYMMDRFFKILSIVVLFAYVTVSTYSGVYFDVQDVATYLIAAIFAPILSYSILRFIVRSSFDYLTIAQNFTRKITLQRIDPLLN